MRNDFKDNRIYMKHYDRGKDSADFTVSKDPDCTARIFIKCIYHFHL
jgi:hypothetical protein